LRREPVKSPNILFENVKERLLGDLFEKYLELDTGP